MSTKVEPIVTSAFVFLVVAHFLQALGWSSMLLLPLYLDWLGATRAEVGTVMAMSAIGGLAARPFVGWSLDMLGRKRTLYAGTAALVTGVLSLGLVHEVGLLVYGARVVMGVGMAALSGA